MTADLVDQVAQTITTLRAIGDDTQHVEVKACAGGLAKTLVESASAFANGTGGLLILGISQEHGFVTVPGFSAPKIANDLGQILADQLEPPLRCPVEVVPFEGALVVACEIPPLPPIDRPCYAKSRGAYGGSFIRGYDGDRKLSAYEVDRLRENRSQPRFDEEIVEMAPNEALNDELVATLLTRLKRTKPRLMSQGDEVALERLHVIGTGADGRKHPTICGLMALGDYPQQFFPRLNVAFAVYPGIDKNAVATGHKRLADSQSIDGTIAQMVQDTVRAVAKNMRVGGIIEGALRRDLPDYPLEAVREAVTNALMHRDYSPISRGTPVQVDMFADRLEITNPGGLFGTVTVSDLGHAGVTSSRNAQLSRLLEDVSLDGDGFISGGLVAENRGTGYATIVSQLHAALLPDPVAQDWPSRFRLTMQHRLLTELEGANQPVAGTREAILAAFARGVSLSASDLMAQSGLSRTTVMRYLNELLDDGKIVATEKKYSPRRRYRLT